MMGAMAIRVELRHGLESLRSTEAVGGARRFASGRERHGGCEEL
jgi:hypothetical protein